MFKWKLQGQYMCLKAKRKTENQSWMKKTSIWNYAIFDCSSRQTKKKGGDH